MSRRAKMPREINYNCGALSNDLFNFKIDSSEIFLWEKICLTIFESRLMWNKTSGVEPWNSLCTCRQNRAAGVESCPVTLLCPSRGWMSPRSLRQAGFHGHPPQQCSPLEGDAFPLQLLKRSIVSHIEYASLWKLGVISDFEWENNLWNGNQYFHFWPFPCIF